MRRRPVLYTPQFVAGFAHALREARADLHDQHFKHLCEMGDLLRELAALRAEVEHLRELNAVVLARHRAEAELAGLYRERSIQQALAAATKASRCNEPPAVGPMVYPLCVATPSPPSVTA